MTTQTPPDDPQPTAPNPRRDAWSAIRGFYYQIQTTVQRWIHLAPLDLLQCESAEDIEVMRHALSEGESHVERVLEQVKIRTTLSLRSDAVVSAVVRYFEAGRLVPAPTLYRFITTATPTRERGLVFPRNLPGLSAWNALRNLELGGPEQSTVANQARALLLNARKPLDIGSGLWNEFQTQIRALSDDEFSATFIAHVEWATGTSDVSFLRQQLCSDAIVFRLAKTEPEAVTLVDLLIAHVFHLLTRPGQKRLTQSDLQTVVAAHSLSASDSALVRLLETFAADTSKQLLRLESRSEEILDKVGALGPTLTTILQRVEGASLQAVDLTIRVVDEPPHAPALFARRAAVAEQVNALVKQGPMTAMRGPAGMGKTMLALRVYQDWPTSRRDWISLRGLARTDVRAHLHLQLALRTNVRSPEVALNVSDYVSEYANVLADGLLVIDDLPNLTSDRRLADYVGMLVGHVQEHAGHVLVTTHSQLPDSVRDVVLAGVNEWAVPAMTIDEIAELMSLAQLPARLMQPGFRETIQAITSGHPVLVAATVRHMMGPDFDQSRLVALLTGDSVKPVRLRTRQSLRDLLPHESARELLDRLSLTNGKFSRQVAFAVAAVQPRVDRCGEILQEMSGVWLTQVSADRFELSPLLSGIGTETLAPSVTRDIHSAIATAYCGEGTIGPYDAIQIVIHLFAAKEWPGLAGFLLQLMGHIQTEKEAKVFEIISLIRPLPAEVPSSARIGILAAQIRIAQLTGGNVSALESDFRAVATEPEGDSSVIGAFIGWLFIGPLSRKTTATLAAEGAIRASRLFAQVKQRVPGFGEGSPLPLEPASLVWAAVAVMLTANDVRGVVNLLCELNDDELRSTFSNSDLARGVEILAARCWILELSKPEATQDWSQAIELLDRLIDKATAAGIKPLLLAAQRAKATVFSDYVSLPSEALDLLATNPQVHDDEELLRRHHLAGCVLLDHLSPSAALEQFDRALAIDSKAEPITFAEACRRASEAAGKLERWTDAIRYAIRAIRVLKDAGLKFERLDMITELSWLHWQLGHRRRAAAATGGVTDALVANVEIDSERFRESFRKAGHVMGWMGSVAEDGEPPKIAWGNTPYTAPYVGFASRSRPAAAASNAPVLPSLFLFTQARLEAAIGLKVRALGHYRRARQSARAYQLDVVECLTASAQAETAASLGEIDEAVEASVFGVRSFIVAGKVSKGYTFENQDIEATWNSADAAARSPMERLAFWKSIAAALAGALARRCDRAQIASLIRQLQQAFAVQETAEPGHWQNLLQLADRHFSTDIGVDEIKQMLASSAGHSEPSMILYLALMSHRDASPRDVCGAQIVCLSAFKSWQTIARSPLVDLALVIQRTWREIAEQRGFLLSGPRLLRNTLAEHAEPSLANAARILLSAQTATGTRLDPALQQFLVTTAGDSV